MTKPSHWMSELARVAVPLVFVSIVAAAVGGITTPLFFAIVLSAGLVIVVIRALFPAGRLFPIAFASLIAVYAAIFSLFVEEMFRGCWLLPAYRSLCSWLLASTRSGQSRSCPSSDT